MPERAKYILFLPQINDSLIAQANSRTQAAWAIKQALRMNLRRWKIANAPYVDSNKLTKSNDPVEINRQIIVRLKSSGELLPISDKQIAEAATPILYSNSDARH